MSSFESFHPLVTFFFFVSVIVLGVCFLNPLFSAVGLLGAALMHLRIRGKEGLRLLGGMAIAFAALLILNPLFNPAGDTVLFTYGLNRPFTLQSLIFSMVTAVMFVTVILWFSSFNAMMTGEKITYLFGRMAPSLSLTLTMVLRLVPTYRRKLRSIMDARAGIGKSGAAGPLASRVRNAGALLSLLATWAFESALVTADSMRSRGFGLPGRTCFAAYRFTLRDGVLLAIEVLLTAVCGAALALGATAVEYFPVISLGCPTVLFWLALSSYVSLVLVPTLIDCWEHVLWRLSLSRI